MTPRKKSTRSEAAEKAEHLYRLLDTLFLSRQTAKSAGEDAKAASDEALDIMVSHNIDRVVTPTQGVSATVVEPENVVLDHAKLKKRLGAAGWTKITKRVPDKALIEKGVTEGWLDPVVLAECSDVVPGTPYIRTNPPRKGWTPKQFLGGGEPF